MIDADALMESIRKALSIKSMTKSILLPAERTIIDQIDSAPTVGGWISVKDRMPEINEPILFTGKNTIGNRYPAQKGYFSGDEWYSFGLIDKCSDGVTHWMPLPEPPEQ